MSKFEEFMRQDRQEPMAPTMVIDGTFQCQVCTIEVDEAEYYNTRKLLKWKCPTGHVSYVEDFSL